MHRARIIRTNGSLTVEIPENLLDAVGLHEGDEIGIGQTEGGIALIPIDQTNEHADEIDPEFAKRVDAFIDKYRDALKSLAQR